MILVWLIVVLLAGGVLAWIAARFRPVLARWISLGALALDLGLLLGLWAVDPGRLGVTPSGRWLAEVDLPWIPRFGIHLHFGLDGLSLLLLLLTVVLGFFSVACSWREIDERVGFFHFNLMWILAGVTGVFLALDLFLFYFFWELMLVPMVFLIAIWGHERRVYAAIKFFLFTQASGLFMLLAILGLAFAHFQASGVLSFEYADLLDTPLAPHYALWLMLGFFVAFAVKLPAVPFHTWLPDAHTQAPTAGSVVLAGLLLKTGAYGLLRFAIPLFPEASRTFAPIALALGALGVVYGAALAFAQSDLKRLVAYSSVSHLGFVLLGIYSFSHLAWTGAVLQMICHGLSTGGLFILVGALAERTGTRDLDRLGGLWATTPRLAGLGLFLALASLGLPGLGNFVAEFLILVGSFSASVLWTAVATVGLVLAAIYSLRIVQRAFHGPNEAGWSIADFGARETAVLGAIAALLLWIGLFPRPLVETSRPALALLEVSVPVTAGAARAEAGEGATAGAAQSTFAAPAGGPR